MISSACNRRFLGNSLLYIQCQLSLHFIIYYDTDIKVIITHAPFVYRDSL